jgi:type III restriction enzyme
VFPARDKDRLRVLLSNDPENYYQQRDIVPPHLIEELNRAKIFITNFHAFQLREQVNASKLTRTILTQDEVSELTETPDQMVRRACRELGNKKNIVVINDEAHHCYRRKPDSVEKVTGDERQETEKREEELTRWYFNACTRQASNF